MGIYLNPGNNGFEEIRRSPYVDKTGLISLINHTIGTKKKLTCISRPRRFGKSYAAQMLCAYYDRTCSSEKLFSDCCIAQDDAGIQKIHSEKTAPLRGYGRDILLVGINYDKNAPAGERKHTCRIVKV